MYLHIHGHISAIPLANCLHQYSNAVHLAPTSGSTTVDPYYSDLSSLTCGSTPCFELYLIIILYPGTLAAVNFLLLMLANVAWVYILNNCYTQHNDLPLDGGWLCRTLVSVRPPFTELLLEAPLLIHSVSVLLITLSMMPAM